jgi:hypothetical protein
MQLNFHKKTGLTPGFNVFRSDYKTSVVYGLRLWWSLLTFTFLRSRNEQK